MSGWQLIDEEDPPMGVVLLASDGCVEVGFLGEDLKWVVQKRNGNERLERSSFTHWMPLPFPPKVRK